MKKIIKNALVLLICFVFAIAFVGCNSNSNDANDGKPAVYSVTYDANGGSFYDGETSFTVNDLSENAILAMPISPNRSGYTLSGWSKGKYVNDYWDFDTDTVTNNLTLYAQWEKVDRDYEVQTFAESMKYSYKPDKLATNLSDSPTEILDENDERIKDIKVANVPEGKKVIYKKRSAGYGLDDLAYYGANNNITYAGALLKLNSEDGNISPLVGIKRKPITLSIGEEGATGVDYQRLQVDKVASSTVGQAINELAKGFTKEGAQLPFMTALQLTEIKAKEELNAALGLQFNVGNFFNLNSEFDFKGKGTKTYAVLTLKQVYYTVNVDYYNEDGAFSILGDSVTKEQLQNACGVNFCPAYVSSVSYGRIAAITIKSEESFSEISAGLNIKANVFITSTELDGELNKLSRSSGIEYNWFVYGGSTSGNQEVLNGKNIGDMIKSLNQPYDPAKQVGKPISYQISHLSDNTAAKLGFTGDYYYAEIVDSSDVKLHPEKSESVSKTFTGEYRVDDNYGDYTAYGAGYIANNKVLSIDISTLDLEYIKQSDCRVEILIELSIKEKDDGYQEIYVYNAGVDKNLAQKGKGKPIASVEVEHGVGKVNKNYQKYRLTAVIAPESITGEKIWIAFDAWGKDEDTWYAKDISITLSKTSKTACTMYSEKV